MTSPTFQISFRGSTKFEPPVRKSWIRPRVEVLIPNVENSRFLLNSAPNRFETKAENRRTFLLCEQSNGVSLFLFLALTDAPFSSSNDTSSAARSNELPIRFKSRCLRKPGRFKRWGSAKFDNTMSTRCLSNMIVNWGNWTNFGSFCFGDWPPPFVLGPREPKWRPKSDQLRDEKIPTSRWFLRTNFSTTLSWL